MRYGVVFVFSFFVLIPLFAEGTNFVGQRPPEIQVKEWLNVEKGVKLSELRGKAVILDFWATT
ncbi:MAG: hypothetical protein N2234_02645 [Planctomycetota bacterium]|nr:hypothetical protein [Planctomycetota bacterium]